MIACCGDMLLVIFQEAISPCPEAILPRLEAISPRLEAISISPRLEAISTRLEAISISSRLDFLFFTKSSCPCFRVSAFARGHLCM
ncbi:hypothetical protein ACLB2K_059799 [Fragaria x ananassa]